MSLPLTAAELRLLGAPGLGTYLARGNTELLPHPPRPVTGLRIRQARPHPHNFPVAPSPVQLRSSS